MLVESICNECNHKQSIEIDVSNELVKQANQKAEEDNSKIREEIIASQAAIDESNTKIKKDQLEIDNKIKAGIKADRKSMAEEIRKEVALEESKKAKVEADKMADTRLQKILDETNTQNDTKYKLLETQYGKAKKGLSDANRKMSQGSMQIQGATAEKSAFEWLNDQFKYDTIETTKNGADITHAILSHGQIIGKILYEVKDTQNFSPDWPVKLKKDVQEANATIGVIISKALPENHMKYGIDRGVFICSPAEVKSLSYLLRIQLIQNYKNLKIVDNQNELRDLLWNVVTGIPFQQKFIAINDSFQAIRDMTISDKKYQNKKWIKQEKEEGIIIANLAGMRGLLQEHTGNALKEVAGLDYDEYLDE